MTKAEQLQAVAILVPADFSDHAVRRIDRTFNQIRIERTDPALVTDEMRRAVRGIASFAGISAAMMDALPNLELIASFGVGYDHVDTGYAREHNIMVTNTPDVLTEEVADTAIGLLINTLWTSRLESLFGLALIASGLPLYWHLQRARPGGASTK